MLSCTGGVSAVRISDRPQVEPVCSTLLGHFPSTSNISWGGVYKPISAALASTSPYHTRYSLWLEHGREHVVPGIVTPGGPPSPPLTRRWGGHQKKSLGFFSADRPIGIHGFWSRKGPRNHPLDLERFLESGPRNSGGFGRRMRGKMRPESWIFFCR